TRRTPMRSPWKAGTSDSRYDPRKITSLAWYPAPRMTRSSPVGEPRGSIETVRDGSYGRYQSRHHSHTFPPMSAIPSGVRPSGREPTGSVALSPIVAREGVGFSQPQGKILPFFPAGGSAPVPRAAYSH